MAGFGDIHQSNPVTAIERRPIWPISSLISFPNDFEEDVNKDSADSAVRACAGTLQRIGRTITFLKYFTLAVAATSLTTVYSLRKSEVRYPHQWISYISYAEPFHVNIAKLTRSLYTRRLS